MEKVLVVVFIILIVAAFMGNVEIITSLFAKDLSLIAEDEFSVFIAIVADIILFCFLFKKFIKPTSNSLLLAKSGFINRFKMIKQSSEIKKSSHNITDSISRLKKLKAIVFDRNSIKRTQHLCRLLVAVSNEENLKICFNAVNKKNLIITEINDIEQNILHLAHNYMAVGNFKKCVYYLEMVDSEQNKFNYEEMKKLCNEQLNLRKKEGKALRLWTIIVAIILSIVLCIFVVLYAKNAPYRELRSKIDNQTLSVEMVNWKNSDLENSYYEYLHSDKGYKFLADVFTELHRNNEIDKAMWLLCVQPDCIDGIDLCASDSFVDWVVDYAKENGTKEVHSNGNITYTIDGYEIYVSSIFDSSIGHHFSISNGKESNNIDIKNPFHKDYVPTIK